MSLAEKITNDLKEALKSGDSRRVSVLRMVKAAIKNKEIEKRASLQDEDIINVLKSFVKRANESIEQFSKAGRTELVQKEKEELTVVQSYLPEQLSEEEIRVIIKDVINETGATSLKDMGKVMKAVMARGKGQIDGKLANTLVKEMLEA
jgi:hypothetical protein